MRCGGRTRIRVRVRTGGVAHESVAAHDGHTPDTPRRGTEGRHRLALGAPRRSIGATLGASVRGSFFVVAGAHSFGSAHGCVCECAHAHRGGVEGSAGMCECEMCEIDTVGMWCGWRCTCHDASSCSRVPNPTSSYQTSSTVQVVRYSHRLPCALVPTVCREGGPPGGGV